MNAAYGEFGSWMNAVGAAGLKYPARKERKRGAYKWTRERILKVIRALSEHGLPIASSGLRQAAVRTFGSVSEARIAARVCA